jgi:lipoprotein
MKKLTAILSLLLSLILLLTGCSTDTVSSSTEVTQTTESSLSTSGLQTIIGADSSVKVLNAYESLDYALNKLEGYIEQGIVESDYMETLKVLSVALKDIETDLNADNASHIKDLMVTADDTVSSAMGMSDDSAYLNSLNDISATVSRIKESADRLISNTGTGGGNNDTTNTSSDRVTVSSTEDNTTNNEGNTSNTTTMTPAAEDSEQIIDTSKIEQGDYTAGGYAPTTADSRYKDNGIVVGWATNIGVKFDRTQTQDLYNFVKSGYTSARTVDARIQSRKGGTDNPRIAWFESYEMGKDNVFVSGYDDGYVGNTITVTYENMTCSDKLLELLKKPMVTDADGDGAFESSTKNWDALLKLNETEDVEKEICAKPEYTSITYNFRNYCGDVIRVGIRGPNVNSYSSYDSIEGTEFNKALAGVDYTLTCDDDPEAFKLITGDELKNYYDFSTKFGSSFNEGETQCLVDRGLLDYRQPVTRCDIYSVAGVTKPNTLGAGAQYYAGVKPGIYHCTVTLKDGKQIPIVIENLPIHYENMLWGCRTQAEMDVCVKFAQNDSQGVYGQYIGGTGIRANGDRGKGTDKELLKTTDNYTEFVKDFNNVGYKTYEGESVKLKNTEQAANWWRHYTGINTEYYARGVSGTYRALDAMTRKGGDCETYSAFMSCMLNVSGYTTRYITGGNHAWVEVKVPAEINESGKDLWLAIDNGNLMAYVTPKMKEAMLKTTVYNEVKGWDTYWNADMPR